MPTPILTSKFKPGDVQTKVELKRIGYSSIFSVQEDDTAFFYQAGMMIDADGAYKAYNADGKSGLDYLGNAGKPGNWWALVTDANGNPIKQSATDPAPGFYIATTSLEDRSKKRTDPKRYVDAGSIPFIVLPGRSTFGASLSDFCLVYNPANEKICGGVFADSGPNNQIGEASIAMANAVGVPSNPKNGGQGHGLIYIVFPNSSIGWPLTNDAIQENALSLFDNWGGIERLKILMGIN